VDIKDPSNSDLVGRISSIIGSHEKGQVLSIEQQVVSGMNYFVWYIKGHHTCSVLGHQAAGSLEINFDWSHVSCPAGGLSEFTILGGGWKDMDMTDPKYAAVLEEMRDFVSQNGGGDIVRVEKQTVNGVNYKIHISREILNVF